MVAVGPAVAFFSYAACALVLSLIIINRLIKGLPPIISSTEKRLLVASRVGIMTLTLGTTLNNFQYFAGSFPGYNVENDVNVGVTWFCAFNHQVLSAIAILVPFQFMVVSVQDEKKKRWLVHAAVALCFVASLVGLAGFIRAQPNSLDKDQNCNEISEPVNYLKLSNESKTGLVCVFAYSFAMIACGVVMVWKRGCGSRWALFLVLNVVCLAGQALVNSLGSGYKCYGSNFWEQVTFIRHRVR